MAVFADPLGAVIGLWQPNQHTGAQLVNEPGTYCWSELITTDLDASKAFYGAVFGWGAEEQGPPGGPPAYTEWKLGGRSVGGMMPKSPDMPAEMPPIWGVYFAVADTDATVAKAQELGASRCSWGRPTSSRGASPCWPTTSARSSTSCSSRASERATDGTAPPGTDRPREQRGRARAAPPAGPPPSRRPGTWLQLGPRPRREPPRHRAAVRGGRVGGGSAPGGPPRRAVHRRQDAAGQPRRRHRPVRHDPPPAQRRGPRPLSGPRRDLAGRARPALGRARADPGAARRRPHPLRRHHRARHRGAAWRTSRRCAASTSTP